MSNPRVTVNQGVLEGLVVTTDNGRSFYSFRGIPFAEPPVGDLRFKPPILHSPWTGVRDATKDGNRCVQKDRLTKELDGSEDCLFLNVYTPGLQEKNAKKCLFPVMVYIHGGGFTQGSGRYEDFHPELIVEQGVIFVSTNYRLGPLGFFCLDILEAPGNVGLRDQSLALNWVKDNIHFFNGDRNNVTLFGISAGAACVEFHLLSPMSQGLFHKAIIQSGSCLCPWAITKDPLGLIDKVKKELKIKYTNPKEVLQYFKNMDAKLLVDVCTELLDEESFETGEICPFTPVVEKDFEGIQPFLNKKPQELMKSGSFSNIPSITGICENEGEGFKNLYQDTVGKLAEQNLLKYLPRWFKVDRKKYDKLIKDVYKTSDDGSDCHVNDFISDVLFVGGIYSSLKIKNKPTTKDHYYLYVFTYMGNLNTSRDKCKYTKAFHADDIGYIALDVHNDKVESSPEDKAVRNRMVKMWTDFAKTGNPTPESTNLIKEKWQPIGKGDEMNLMEIGKELKMTIMPWKARISLWENLYKNI